MFCLRLLAFRLGLSGALARQGTSLLLLARSRGVGSVKPFFRNCELVFCVCRGMTTPCSFLERPSTFKRR